MRLSDNYRVFYFLRGAYNRSMESHYRFTEMRWCIIRTVFAPELFAFWNRCEYE
jgi:hypothetical protein